MLWLNLEIEEKRRKRWIWWTPTPTFATVCISQPIHVRLEHRFGRITVWLDGGLKWVGFSGFNLCHKLQISTFSTSDFSSPSTIYLEMKYPKMKYKCRQTLEYGKGIRTWDWHPIQHNKWLGIRIYIYIERERACLRRTQ